MKIFNVVQNYQECDSECYQYWIEQLNTVQYFLTKEKAEDYIRLRLLDVTSDLWDDNDFFKDLISKKKRSKTAKKNLIILNESGNQVVRNIFEIKEKWLQQ